MSVDLFPDATEEQRTALETVSLVIERECPMTVVRQWLEQPMPMPEGLWRAMGDVGCFGLLVDEDHGGGSLSGNGVVDAALVAAERGAMVQPGPFVGTVVVAHLLATLGASHEHRDILSELLAGRAAATWATANVFDDSARSDLSLRDDAGGSVASGVIRSVQDAHHCNWVLVGLPAEAGLQPFLLDLSSPTVSMEQVDGLDLTRTFWDVRLDECRLDGGAQLGLYAGPAGAWVERLLALAAVLSAAESVGAMDANLQIAVDYAKSRYAFGRPIGSFQGLKHGLADTSLFVEMAKGIVASAAEALGRDASDALQRAGVARSFVSDHAVDVAQRCFQVFGGIGYTWEHDQHLFLRRLASEAPLYGGPAWHRRRLWQDPTGDPSKRSGEDGDR